MSKIEELKKKFDLFKNEKGELVFDFSSEEQARINETFQNLKEQVLRPDIADEFQEMLTSIALISLGDEYLMRAKDSLDYEEETEVRNKEIDENLEHVIMKYGKALSMYPNKTIFFSLANVLIMRNDIITAKEFLNNYITYIQPEKYSETVTNLFLLYHLQILGYGSIEELDNEVNSLIKNL